MAGLVNIKSLKDGLLIKLDGMADFTDIYNEVCEKFNESAKFFGNAKVVVSFEGRKLSEPEENELINAITLNSDMTVLCVVGDDEETNNKFIRAKNALSSSGDLADGNFIKGDIRAHENIETDSSIIIMGDVNPGAVVASKGNIVILGTLYGTAVAGSSGDRGSFIVTLDMKSARVQIADIASDVMLRSSVFSKNKVVPRVSYIAGREVVTEEISRELLSNLTRR